ncbi:glycosyltransferase family 2 protein [Phaeovulum sp.]|uniref:glycosyltransferase family 2 protein n=1 Tax=Phaeovulum sp. TaxID=2934796 RepID=UPI0039E3E2EF
MNVGPGKVLIVIPTLNEAAHIGAVIEGLRPFCQHAAVAARDVSVIVVDGGSSDATRPIVGAATLPNGALHLLDNPARIQGAAVNLAVQRFGDAAEWLIRVDAHAVYPGDYCDVLLNEAAVTGADSVVVAMRAVGRTPFQRAVALAQNTRIGNGGAAHRIGAAGKVVDHGHHALMRVSAFRAVGGYDPAFSHNEDAELDLRLGAAGGKIWLTGRTGLDYLPRDTAFSLIRQYRNFGRGRAQTLIKHQIRPRMRQAVVIAVVPAVLLAVLGFVHPMFALPAAVWLAGCLGGGLALALRGHGWTGLAAGGVAALMHLAWSFGFWTGLFRRAPAQRAAP